MKTFIKSLFTSAYLLALPMVVGAQTTNTGNGPTTQTVNAVVPPLQNPLGSGTSTLCALFKALLSVMLQVGVPALVFFLVFAGFKFVWARGNPGALEKARENLLYTVVGIGLFLGAWALAMVVAATINQLSPNTIGSC